MPAPSRNKIAGNTFSNPMIIIGTLFFVFGFVTWLGSVLIPYLKIACELNDFESYLVAFSFYISYFIMAIPSAWVLKKTGYKKGMSLGLVIMSAGALVFIPAAFSRLYILFLAGLFIQGVGLSVLQTASNPYVTMLGSRESAARRISIMGVCNGVAGVIAPILLGIVALKDADLIRDKITHLSALQKAAELDELAKRVVLPYVIMMIVLLLLAVLVFYSGLPELDGDGENEKQGIADAHKTSILQFPHLLLGVFTLFLYVGVEVIAGDTIIRYGSYQGIPLSKARFFTSCTLVNMLIGYIIGILCIPRYIAQAKALYISSIAGLFFAALALITHGMLSVVFISLLGLANALMWPSIWPLAITGLGRFTRIGSSLLIMAIGGGALLPLLYGRLSDLFNPHTAYWVLIPCYSFILYYAYHGHKIRTA
jgi:glucose/galactose transporter